VVAVGAEILQGQQPSMSAGCLAGREDRAGKICAGCPEAFGGDDVSGELHGPVRQARRSDPT
jgi:hypothetical protein